MPLQSGKSKQAFHANVRELVDAGHPLKQAVAIAYKQRRLAEGGVVEAPAGGPQDPGGYDPDMNHLANTPDGGYSEDVGHGFAGGGAQRSVIDPVDLGVGAPSLFGALKALVAKGVPVAVAKQAARALGPQDLATLSKEEILKHFGEPAARIEAIMVAPEKNAALEGADAAARQAKVSQARAAVRGAPEPTAVGARGVEPELATHAPEFRGELMKAKEKLASTQPPQALARPDEVTKAVGKAPIKPGEAPHPAGYSPSEVVDKQKALLNAYFSAKGKPGYAEGGKVEEVELQPLTGEMTTAPVMAEFTTAPIVAGPKAPATQRSVVHLPHDLFSHVAEEVKNRYFATPVVGDAADKYMRGELRPVGAPAEAVDAYQSDHPEAFETVMDFAGQAGKTPLRLAPGGVVPDPREEQPEQPLDVPPAAAMADPRAGMGPQAAPLDAIPAGTAVVHGTQDYPPSILPTDGAPTERVSYQVGPAQVTEGSYVLPPMDVKIPAAPESDPPLVAPPVTPKAVSELDNIEAQRRQQLADAAPGGGKKALRVVSAFLTGFGGGKPTDFEAHDRAVAGDINAEAGRRANAYLGIPAGELQRSEMMPESALSRQLRDTFGRILGDSDAFENVPAAELLKFGIPLLREVQQGKVAEAHMRQALASLAESHGYHQESLGIQRMNAETNRQRVDLAGEKRYDEGDAKLAQMLGGRSVPQDYRDAGTAVRLADNALELAKGAQGARPFSPQEAELLAGELAKIATGGAPGETLIHQLATPTAQGKLSALGQYLTGEPMDAGLKARVQQVFIPYLQKLRRNSLAHMVGYQNAVVQKMKHALRPGGVADELARDPMYFEKQRYDIENDAKRRIDEGELGGSSGSGSAPHRDALKALGGSLD